MDTLTSMRVFAAVAARGSFSAAAQAMALYELSVLQDQLKQRSAPDTMTRAHTQHLLFMIGQSLEPATAG